jgi:hypothetical protein
MRKQTKNQIIIIVAEVGRSLPTNVEGFNRGQAMEHQHRAVVEDIVKA